MPEWFTNDNVKQVFSWLMEDERGKAEGGKSNIDYVKDYRYIYPSFRQVYGIDLNKENLTWWEFSMLIEGCFFSECMIKSVLDIRSRKIPPKASQEVKESLLSLKHKYGLAQKDNGLSTLFKSLEGVSKWQ